MNLSFIPNVITILRVVLLIPLSTFLINENYQNALFVFVIAGVSDALDGFLAKQFGWVSRFGAILDPLADKALLITTIVILAINQQISWILFGLIVLRDVFIVSGAYYFHYRLGPYEMKPSKLSKLNTFVQLFLVTCILVSAGLYTLSPAFIEAMVIATYVTTLSSGIHYGWVWGKKFKVELYQLKSKSSPTQKTKNQD
ncbi:CDP-alcohol phosphatidyltransferase family protein [Aliikangiella sp. IMCC44632]